MNTTGAVVYEVAPSLYSISKAILKYMEDAKTEKEKGNRQEISYTIHHSYYLDDVVKHLERCMTHTPKMYNKAERVPTGYKPTRLF